MNYSMKRHLQATPQARAFLWLLAWFIIAVTGANFSIGQVSQTSSTNQPPAARGDDKHFCPAVNNLPPPALPAKESDHRVILSWHASAFSPHRSDAFGYCLYRSKTENPAKENPPCRDCEQINVEPVQGTSCVDSTVDDNVPYYYYIAMAVDANGNHSDFSNYAPAPILLGNQSGPTPAGSQPPPSCQGASAAK